jgi:hypothetical protein
MKDIVLSNVSFVCIDLVKGVDTKMSIDSFKTIENSMCRNEIPN